MKNFLLNLLWIPIFSFSQYGVLDESFGIGGIVLSEPPLADNLLFQDTKEVLVDNSGNIYIVGDYQYGENYNENSKIVISKFSGIGVKDISFAENGTLMVNLPFQFSTLGSAFLTNDQKIIGVGYTNYFIDNSQMFLFKLNLDGTFDAQFGNAGLLTFPELGLKGMSVATDETANLYIAGNISNPPYNWNYIILKMNSQGEIVNSFGDNGRLVFDFAEFDANPKIVFKQSKLYFAGDSNVHNSGIFHGNSLILMKMNLDGILDDSFGNQGVVVLKKDWGGFWSSSITMNEFGEIYAVGATKDYMELDYDLSLLKFEANGELNTEFGNNGMIITDFSGGNDFGYNVLLYDNNTPLLTGFATKNQDSDFLLMKYIQDGSLDNSFGENGIVLTNINENSGEISKASVMIGNTHIIIAGTSDYNIALAKYKINPRLEVDDISINSKIQIAPNPTSNSFVINGLNGVQNQVQIIDLTGKMVQEFNSVQNNQTLNLGSIPKGTYILKIQSGNFTESKKLIVK